MKKPVRVFFLTIVLSAPSAEVGLAERVFPPESPNSGAVRSAAADPASDFFDIGVLVGKVEQGAWEGADPKSLVPHLVQIRERAAKTGGDQSHLKDLEVLIEAMESATESRDLHERIVEFRKSLALRIARQDQVPAVAEPADEIKPFDCDQGSWEGVWETTWGDMTLVFDEEGQFHGTYGPSQHAVSGAFDPDHPKVLRGRWNHFGSTSTGGIRFEMKAPGRFEGGWSGEVPVVGNGSTWNGTRRRTHHSEILVAPIGEASIVEPEKTGVRTWSQPLLIKKGFSVHGRTVEFPLVRIYTLALETGEWESGSPGYSDIGAGIHKVPAGGSFTMLVLLPEELARRKIAVEFARREVVDGEEEENLITIRTRPFLLVPPKPVANEVEAFPPEEGGEAEPEAGKEEAPPDRAEAGPP